MQNLNNAHSVIATVSSVRPPDFPLGSIESRAAVRILVEAKRQAQTASSLMVQEKLKDPLTWLQRHTKTKDPHWREAGASTPHRPFPDKPYFRPTLEVFQQEPIVFDVKSRDLMLSWLTVGFFTHACMTTAGIEVLFQSQTEEKAAELISYSKCLYDNSDDDIREACPLPEPSDKQSWLELSF